MHKYWPDTGSFTFGLVTIEFMGEDVIHKDELNVRHFQLSHTVVPFVYSCNYVKESDKTLVVNQYHLLQWPDQDVPQSTMFVRDLINIMTKQTATKNFALPLPTVVHCR